MSVVTSGYISLQASSYPSVEAVVGDEEAPATVAVQAVTLIVTAIAGCATNTMVAVVFYRRPTLRSPSNRFVLSLVLANVLASLVVTPAVVVQLSLLRRIWWLRQVAAGLTTLAVTAAVFSVLAIAVDRYHAVLSPLHYAMTVTQPRSRGMVAGAWLVAALLALPVLLGATDHACSSTRVLALVHALVLAGLGFVLPLVALCWIYSRMYRAAHLNSERTRRHSVSVNPSEVAVSRPGSLEMPLPPKPPVNPPPPRRRCSNASFSALFFREEGRAVKTAAMVITSFLLCFTPYFTALVLDAWDDRLLPGWLRFFGLLAALGSGCLTPFIYVFRNEAARVEALKVLFFWRRGRGQYGNNVSRDFENYNQSKTGNGIPGLDQSVSMRRQSLSYCDSVSVQSFQISTKLAECRHCSLDPPVPTADFVATYEIMESPVDQTAETDAKPKEDNVTKTRRESVTFRLAFLPQRRCQSCIRQNSDSSSGSGHPLLKDGDLATPPMQKAISNRRQRYLAARQSSSGDEISGSEPGTPKHLSATEFNNNIHAQKKGGDSVILELDEPVRGRTVPRSPTIFQETSLECSVSSDDADADTTLDSETLRQDSGYSDATVDSSVIPDLSVAAGMTSVSTTSKRHRPRLQRLAAVEDEGDATEGENLTEASNNVKNNTGFRTHSYRPACLISKGDI